jgi:hypothetical protein
MIERLIKQCAEFEKLAVHLQENTDPVLKQLSDLKSFDERVEFADKRWKKLGEGSSRTVFEINQFLIIKIAHNEKGISQNENEMKLDLQRPCAAKVIVADPKGKWIISHWTKTITEKEFKEILGFGFKSFVNSLSYAYNNEDNLTKPREYDEIKHHSFFNCIGKMIVDGDLLIGDLSKISSYGAKDGKIYLRDYGFDKETYKTFYEDKT